MKKQVNKLEFDLGLFLLITGALANITIWVGAFVATEAQGAIGDWVRTALLPVLGGVSGLSMGFTVTVGLVYVLSRLGKMKPTTEHKVRGKQKYRTVPNVRYYTAWAAIVLLLIISPALLAPYVFMTISGAESLYAVLGPWWAEVWSVGRIIAADLAISAVALVYGVQLHAIAGGARATSSPKGAARGAKGVSQSEPSAISSPTTPTDTAQEMRVCEVPECGKSYRWPQGKGGHYKRYHPDLVIRKGIPAQVSLPIKAEKK